jgi:hypothetical protein
MMAGSATSVLLRPARGYALSEHLPSATGEAPTAPRTLVQLVAPGPGGVRDYLESLRRQWNTAGLPSHVVALSQADARARSLADRLERLTDQEGHACSLLLHFSGYGYQKRGLCFWLLRELEHARARLGSRLHVVTMFHELFASGPPWQSAFWLSGAQAWIAERLVRASDRVLTNSQHHAHELRYRLGARAPVHVWPVFSTVGEPTRVRPASERALRLVVFGAESTRRRALERLPRHVELLRRHGVVVLVEAGPGIAVCPPALGLDRRFVGRLDEPTLRTLLEGSAFGLIDYPSIHLGKSTVFAAYLVHGCVVLNTAPGGPDADGLERGQHYLTLDDTPVLPPTAAERQVMADAGRAWYARHTLARQAVASAHLCGAAFTRQTRHA